MPIRKDGPIESLLALARQDQDILAVILFGSQARGVAHAGSDFDICLVLQEGAGGAASGSEKRLTYSIAPAMDVQIFQRLPLHLRCRVLRDGRVLYCRDEDALYDIAFRTAQRFEDFRHIHEEYLEAIASG